MPSEKLRELATTILTKPNGDDVLLDAIAMKLHGKSPDDDLLGAELRQLGPMAATQRSLNNRNDPGVTANYLMKQVLQACLRFDGNEHNKVAWLDAIFDVVDWRHGSLNSLSDAALASAQLMPPEFLNRVSIVDDERRQKRSYFVVYKTDRTLVLSDVNVDTLIAYCGARNDPKARKVIASGLQLWVSTDSDKTVQLTDTAVRFLEASPVPEDILKVLASKVTPNSWSGSRADVMERRSAALKGLVQRPDTRIQVGTRQIVGEAMKWICLQRQIERREDVEQEHCFE